MGAPRRKGALAARRRPGDEGEDDGFAVGQDDSLSEPSVPSDVDDDADGEGSESSEVDTPSRKQNGKATVKNGARSDTVVAEKESQFAAKVADTDIMLNGLTIADGSEQVEEIHFDHLPESQALNPEAANDSTETPAKPVSLADQRRREHDEYKKRRDADPAFVPNRGGFYMHDERHAAESHTANGHRPAIRGRGRGRGGFVSNNFEHAPQADHAPWTHDLHETVVDPGVPKSEPSQTAADTLPDNQRRPVIQPMSNPPPNRTFSSTVQIGDVRLQVYLPSMNDPIVFSSVPIRQHTRLPHHRPPLRRDKPVRISLPNSPVRYIFPAVDRSFIFIPRALRPNQQGFGRSRGRGSIGGPGGLRSGRNSIYGGSVYTPSVAMSRRSSFARERDGMVSPAMSVMSRVTGPVGRMPNGSTPQQGSTPVHFGQQVPYKSIPPPHGGFPHAANYSNIPMHQPRPQKAVAVADIEPHGQQYQQGFAGPQPFAHQVPPQFGDPNMSRRPSYPSQRGTPLSNIPERAIHAQPFQPYPQGPYHQQMGPQMAPPPPPPQQMYYPQQPYGQGMYYYPQGPPQQAPPLGQPQYNGYMAAPPQPPPMPEPAAQTGMVAHESNGMVYYYEPNAVPADAATQQANVPYQQMSYGPDYMMASQQQGAVYYPPPPV